MIVQESTTSDWTHVSTTAPECFCTGQTGASRPVQGKYSTATAASTVVREEHTTRETQCACHVTQFVLLALELLQTVSTAELDKSSTQSMASAFLPVLQEPTKDGLMMIQIEDVFLVPSRAAHFALQITMSSPAPPVSRIFTLSLQLAPASRQSNVFRLSSY